MEAFDLADGEQFAALKLSPCSHPNGKSREVLPPLCAICLCSYKVGDNVTFSPNESCQHAFHKECTSVWVARKKQPLCPCCQLEGEVPEGEESGGEEVYLEVPIVLVRTNRQCNLFAPDSSNMAATEGQYNFLISCHHQNHAQVLYQDMLV
jgi:hypothetical protein